MSAEAFENYTKGKTLFYGNGGEAYGVERYLDDRRVVWSFLTVNANTDRGTNSRARSVSSTMIARAIRSAGPFAKARAG